MFSAIRAFFAAAPHIPRLPNDEARRLYPRYRWRVMEATYIGYATYYLVRNNFSVVAKDMEAAIGYNDSQIGSILAITAISYGLGKFLMGAVSDRSNPKVFMAFGLLLTGLCNLAFGGVKGFGIHLTLWGLNGFVQGMGWPPCGRSMGHWFSQKERGLTFSIWNTAHNVGGGVAGYLAGWAAMNLGGWLHLDGWRCAFIVPGIMAIAGAFYLFWRLCDTPQSVGLPPIEEYAAGLKPTPPSPPVAAGEPDPSGQPPVANYASVTEHAERELSFSELFVDYVLTNKYVWLLAIANFFAYVARYSMLDWGPKYLREVKDAILVKGGMAVMILEFAGIASTIALGWLSDRLDGRRGMVATLSMAPILAAFTAILFIPAGYLWLDMTMLFLVGFFIYPVINLIVIQALDLTSKKAIGTAAGFIGLLGYLGRTCQAQGFGWMLDYFKPRYGVEAAWEIVIYSILACTALAVVLLAFTWKLKPRT